jgi:plasmid stabilization system protein ParE
MRVRFHPAAELDLAEAADAYDLESEGLGGKLIAKVRVATDLACKYPQIAPRDQGAVRRKMIDGFPYSILYSVEEAEIFVVAVAHHRRHPAYWLPRLKDRPS